MLHLSIRAIHLVKLNYIPASSKFMLDKRLHSYSSQIYVFHSKKVIFLSMNDVVIKILVKMVEKP